MRTVRFAAFRSTRLGKRTSAARLAAAAAACLLFAEAGVAHRAPGSLTTIEWNARTGKTEVVHRLHSHDAELGVGTITDTPQLSALSLEGRARIALYVEERFGIRQNDEALRLDLLGAELVADYLLVYQELPARLEGEISVRDDILRDVFPAQINQVNIQDGRAVRTLTFAGDDGWKAFLFKSETE